MVKAPANLLTDTDSRCTPKWLADKLPVIDLDPCSNANSHVVARRCVCLPDNGLDVKWDGLSMYINPPFSDVGPWASKAASASYNGARIAMLVKLDASTEWYREARRAYYFRAYPFRKRVAFEPFSIGADFPCVMFTMGDHQHDAQFWQAIDRMISDGVLWSALDDRAMCLF